MDDLFTETAAQVVEDVLAPGAEPLSPRLRDNLPRLCPFASMGALFEHALTRLRPGTKDCAVWPEDKNFGYLSMGKLQSYDFFIGDLARKAFDFSASEFSLERRYFKAEEVAYALNELRMHPEIPMGVALMLAAIGKHGAMGEAMLEDLQTSSEQVVYGFGKIHRDATSWDGRFLIGAALVLFQRETGGPLTADTVKKAFGWLAQVGGFCSLYEGETRRCSADEFITAIAAMPLFVNSEKKNICLLAFIDTAAELIKDMEHWGVTTGCLKRQYLLALTEVSRYRLLGRAPEHWQRLSPEQAVPRIKKTRPASAAGFDATVPALG